MTSLSAAGFAALLLLAAMPAPVVEAQASALAPISFRPAAMGLPGATSGLAAASVPSPTYDEQIGATFTQSVSSITYNVTAQAQTDANGYGPAYIINGLSSTGYWYQVGISYHWPSSGGGYFTGFGFNYQVYSPGAKSVFPSNGGSGIGGFSTAIEPGDNVLLTLAFSGTTVTMSAQDTVHGGVAQTSFSAEGASTFVGVSGGPSNSHGFFTGIMTEWYHVSAYTGSEGKVSYSNSVFAVTSAWLWADEFSSVSSGAPVFDNQTKSPVVFSDSSQFYPFESNGATIYGSAHEFITGLLNSAVSTLTLKPDNNLTMYPGFVATYTLAGLQQTSVLDQLPANTIEADPGTSVTVSINTTSSTSLERWVFAGTSDQQVSFAAGQDLTYVYYELVEEMVSAGVTGGSPPLTSSPQLTYEVPGTTQAYSGGYQVGATQNLTTSPVAVYTIIGTHASVSASVPGTTTRPQTNETAVVSAERWATPIQNWTVTGPNVIPNPIEYYQQVQVNAAYYVLGGGDPSELPQFTYTQFGTASKEPVDGTTPPQYCPASGCTGGSPAHWITPWVDVGSSFAFTSTLNSTSPGERWVGAFSDLPISESSAGIVLYANYTHQFYETFGTNDPTGGSVSPSSGWFDANQLLSATASASQGWKFERWSGSGQDAYEGTQATVGINATGSFVENATFYPGLIVSADPRTVVTYSYPGASGTIPAGTSQMALYVPPGTNVTLRASPALFLYSFDSWSGAGRSVGPSTYLIGVDGPTTAVASSGYDLLFVAAFAAAVVAAVAVALALAIRSRRNRAIAYGPFA